MGATGLAAPGAPPSAVQAPPGRIALAVVGAHLAGLPLNDELVELGGTFLGSRTTADYELYALPSRAAET